MEVLNNRPKDLRVIVVSRNTKPELIEITDPVTEVTLIIDLFCELGGKADMGVEFQEM